MFHMLENEGSFMRCGCYSKGEIPACMAFSLYTCYIYLAKVRIFLFIINDFANINGVIPFLSGLCRPYRNKSEYSCRSCLCRLSYNVGTSVISFFYGKITISGIGYPCSLEVVLVLAAGCFLCRGIFIGVGNQISVSTVFCSCYRTEDDQLGVLASDLLV